ncbi:NmrA family transcriptional regulator, putative [Rhizophagus clarus]|uniref:NmrA family transcriptional regulator, putative n=1 Tax=Rhizophagus clarus TaxID=94130 RepID=A0A8H3LUD3_9GLOM|nr:NmrA family transcriptional regulator, putative [Rhizophagus clarus]
MSQNKKLIVVSGATGAQGGSVVNSLLATGHYKIRGLTRKPDSDKAKALKSKGVEVFKCDLSNKDEVKEALKGADIAWIVTNFWDPSIVGQDVNEEVRQGKMIADVAKEEGVNWLFYSSLPNTTTESGGKYSEILHFAGKNNVEQYIRKLGIPNVTFNYLGFYSQNFGGSVPTKQKENGEIEIVFPYLEEDDKIPMIDVESDTGPIVAKIIEEGPEKWNGKKVPVAAEYATLKSIAESFTKATGKTHKIKTAHNDEEVAKEFPPSFNNEEFKQMYKWFKEFGYYGKDTEVNDLSVAKKLHPNIKTFEKYVLEHYGKA